MSSVLPPNPNLEHLKKQAKDLFKSFQAGDVEICATLQLHLPRFARSTPDGILSSQFSLHDAQHVVAREYGFDHWLILRETVVDSRSASGTSTRAPSDDTLEEKMRRHIDALGFHSVGSYRIWCHKQGLDKGIEKEDEQLLNERALFHRLAKTRRPPPKKDYRPAQERFLTMAYEGKVSGVWEGWAEPFAGIEEPAERQALYRLLVQCEKYAKIGGPPLWRLARYHRDWLWPVEDWFPRSDNSRRQLAELTDYLLGSEGLLLEDASPPQDVRPSAHYARTRERRNGRTVLSPDAVAAYEELGYVRVKEAFPPSAALEMQDFMWSSLERMHGIRRDDPATWPEDRRSPHHWTSLKLNTTRDHSAYRAIGAPRLMDAVEEIAGERAATEKKSWGAFVVTFPEAGGKPWGLGHRWTTYGERDRAWMWRVALFFSDVGSHGGGRLVVESSHRLVQAFLEGLSPSERAHKRWRGGFFNSHSYFAELTGQRKDQGDRERRFMGEQTRIDDVDVRVVELTGEPGDAVFYHPAIVTCVSPNVSGAPAFTRG